MSEDLVTWLRTQIDEDERDALEAEGNGHWDVPSTGVVQLGGVEDLDGLVVGPRAFAYHVVRHDPAQVLRRVKADRLIIDACEHNLEFEDYGWSVAQAVPRLLALAYADRPGYRDEWRP